MGNVIIRIITVAVKAISPELRNLLSGTLSQLKKQAEATDNPWDDLFVDILITLLDVKE